MEKKIGENKKINNMRNYLEWNKEMSEKRMNLGDIYDTCEGNIDEMIKILKYEIRSNSTTHDEIKICKLISKLTGADVLLDYTSNFIIYVDFFYVNTIRGNYCFKSNNFHHWDLVTKIKKVTHSPDDPYGEEDWGE